MSGKIRGSDHPPGHHPKEAKVIVIGFWQQFWAQAAWQLIRWYGGNDKPPSWWTKQHEEQVENWLINRQ